MTRNTRRHKTIAYDADGNRTVKEHGGGEAVWVNSKHAGTTTDTVTYSIYPNPYFSVNGNRWTMHYYIGGERFASKTGFISGGFGGLSTTENKFAGHDSGMTIRYDAMRHAQEDSIDSIYAHLGVPYGAHHTGTRGDGWHLYLSSTRDGDNMAYGSGGLRGNHPLTLGEGRVYFYNRDHLGSTMSVTDSIGNTVQQVEYTPWGEVLVERRFGSSGFDTPYLFNGKELDEETGLYYYGARYYDPKMSVWYSTDPMELDYPGTSSYGYCLENPINAIDSYGKEVVWNIWNGSHSKIIKALTKTNIYNNIFYRFIKNQDNVIIMPSNDMFWGYANPERMPNGYSIEIGKNGFVKNGLLVADPTMIAKVIMHEGLHTKYSLVMSEGNLSGYPTLNKHMQQEYNNKEYEGEHGAMAEGNINTLVQGMKEFDISYGTSHSSDWYNAMAWWGSLMRTSGWRNLDETLKNKYELIQYNEKMYMDYLDAKATYYKNRTNETKAAMDRANKLVDWKLFKKTRNE